MGYYEALRGRAQKIESKSLGKKAAKKGLWGSVGRTLGGLAATALLGQSAGIAQQSLKWGMKGKPQKETKPLIKGFIGLTVGTGLLGGIASGINKL